MKYKGVPFKEMEKTTNVSEVLPIVRKAAIKDRELMGKVCQPLASFPPSQGLTHLFKQQQQQQRVVLTCRQSKLAFVSFVRGYKEHYYKYIFAFERLNLGRLAMAFALLQVPPLTAAKAHLSVRTHPQLPSMPEIRGKKIDGFDPVEIDLDKVPFIDKTKEKQRQVKLKKEAEKRQQNEGRNKRKASELKNSAPWSRNQAKKEKRDKRRTLKENKRKKIVESKTIEEEEDEWQELENDLKEERLMKKLKRGKISRTEFEKRTGEQDLEEELRIGLEASTSSKENESEVKK